MGWLVLGVVSHNYFTKRLETTQFKVKIKKKIPKKLCTNLVMLSQFVDGLDLDLNIFNHLDVLWLIVRHYK